MKPSKTRWNQQQNVICYIYFYQFFHVYIRYVYSLEKKMQNVQVCKLQFSNFECTSSDNKNIQNS